MMRLLINTFGTRGDIQPFVALALGMQRAGHSVRICTAEGYRSFIEGYGLDYAPMDNSLYEFMNSQEGKETVEGNRSPLAMIKQVTPMIRRALDDEWAAAQAFEPDIILHHPKSLVQNQTTFSVTVR